MPTNIRDRYLDSLTHIDAAYVKVIGQVGRGHLFSFPDVFKLSEGLFLNAWTCWETFLRDLLWLDLASDTNGALGLEVSRFRTANAKYRLSQRILNHPDHPDKFVEWSDYSTVVKRANELLGAGHRFANPLPQAGDIALLKRIRNAIAHKSDRAWESFKSLAVEPPFALAPAQRKGLTTGRFLYAHQWNGTTVMQNSVAVLRGAANALVP